MIRRVTGHITEHSLHAKDYSSASHVASHLMFTGRSLVTLVLHTRKPGQREVGGGIGMGNTCKPMAVSFQCMTKSTTNKKEKKRKEKKTKAQGG